MGKNKTNGVSDDPTPRPAHGHVDDDEGSLFLNVERSIAVNEPDADHGLVCRWPVRVSRWSDEGGNDKQETVAEFDLLVVHDGLIDELGESVWECLDAESAEADQFATLLWQSNGEMNEPWADAISDGPVLIVLEPPALAIGPRMVQRLIDEFHPRLVVVELEFPNQRSDWEPYGYHVVSAENLNWDDRDREVAWRSCLVWRDETLAHPRHLPRGDRSSSVTKAP